MKKLVVLMLVSLFVLGSVAFALTYEEALKIRKHYMKTANTSDDMLNSLVDELDSATERLEGLRNEEGSRFKKLPADKAKRIPPEQRKMKQKVNYGKHCESDYDIRVRDNDDDNAFQKLSPSKKAARIHDLGFPSSSKPLDIEMQNAFQKLPPYYGKHCESDYDIRVRDNDDD